MLKPEMRILLAEVLLEKLPPFELMQTADLQQRWYDLHQMGVTVYAKALAEYEAIPFETKLRERIEELILAAWEM